jgi:hypothetical protein
MIIIVIYDVYLQIILEFHRIKISKILITEGRSSYINLAIYPNFLDINYHKEGLTLTYTMDTKFELKRALGMDDGIFHYLYTTCFSLLLVILLSPFLVIGGIMKLIPIIVLCIFGYRQQRIEAQAQYRIFWEWHYLKIMALHKIKIRFMRHEGRLRRKYNKQQEINKAKRNLGSASNFNREFI